MQLPDETNLSKREVKRKYVAAEIGLSDALFRLILDHGLLRLEALRYLGL